MAKLKLASYWAAACGGCDVAILDIHEKILDLAAAADIVFWPIATDFKYSDVEAMPDGHIDVTLFHGAVRNSENEHLAHLLRAKSKVLVAFGSCAHIGGIPGLANLFTREEIFKRVYHETPSTVNPENMEPQTKARGAGRRTHNSGILQHGQNSGPGCGRRLLHARMPSDAQADLECRAGDRERPASAQGFRYRGLRKNAVRRMPAQEEGKEDYRLSSELRPRSPIRTPASWNRDSCAWVRSREAAAMPAARFPAFPAAAVTALRPVSWIRAPKQYPR